MFSAKDYEIGFRVKIHNYFAGRFGRKDLFRGFCEKNGIDRKKLNERKLCLPENYLIEHKEISYLSGIRDKLILSFYDDYRDAQKETIDSQNQLKQKIDDQDNVLEVCKDRLARNRMLLKRAKTPIDQIHYENVVETLKTRIKNEKREKAYYASELKKAELQYTTNIRNWDKQISIIEKLLKYRCKSFEKNISKIVRKRLGFTDFYSCLDDHSNDVKRILKGELYEKEN